MTKKTARKVEARQRQTKVGGKYTDHLKPKEGSTDLEKRVNEAFLILNSGLYFKDALAPTREQLFTRIQQALRVLYPERAVLEQAADEHLVETMDKMFGPAPIEAHAQQAYALAEKALAARQVQTQEMIKAAHQANPELKRDLFTVNDTMFNEHLRTITPRSSDRQTILTFLRWLRTTGPECMTSGFGEAFISAEDRVDEYLKKKSHPWHVPNMGHAIAKDVKRDLPSVQIGRIEHKDDQNWGAYFTVDGRAIEMTVTSDTIRLSTGPNDKAAAYHDQVSAVQTIVHHLEDKGKKLHDLRKQEPHNFIVQKSGPISRLVKTDEPDDNPDVSYVSPRILSLAEIRIEWMLRENVTRCTNLKSRLLGVTDGKDTEWVPLTKVKGDPEFGNWWRNLPMANLYVRLKELFKPVETNDDRVVRIWLNVQNYAQLRKHAGTDLQPVNQREVLLAGIYGHIWNAEVRVSKKIPDDRICLIGADDGDADLNPYWVPREDQLITI